MVSIGGLEQVGQRRPFLQLAVLGVAVAIGLAFALQPDLAPALFALPLAVAGLWVVARAPGIPFAAFLLIPFYKGEVQPYSPVDITVLLALANAAQIFPVVAAIDIRRGRRSLGYASVGPATRAWAAIAAVLVVGVLYASDVDLALSHATDFILLVFLPMLAALRVASEPRHLRQLIWTVIGLGGIAMVAGLLSFSQSSRLTVLGANTIGAGRVLLFVPLVGLPFLMRGRTAPLQAICLALTPLALILSAASGSRGPIFMLVVTVLLFGLRRLNTAVARFGQNRELPRIAWRRIFAIILVIVLLPTVLRSSALADLLPTQSLSRFELLFDFLGDLGGSSNGRGSADDSGTTRALAFEHAIDMFEARPLLGYGSAGFAESVNHGDAPSLVGLDYPHNLILEFAANHGLLGLAAFAVVLTRSMRKGLRLRASREWNTLFVLYVFVFLNELVSGDIVGSRMFWGLAVLFLAAPRLDVGEIDRAR